ncbi:Gfo/Idh/MocA family oxidoreductase [Streptomyces sp. NPDC035033]|uniref:Gfo/Idh/MocA family protein n=1 Tax=Streptomyces sp. NPDC035033 TaxID=3155368 RepID=UPI0034054684
MTADRVRWGFLGAGHIAATNVGPAVHRVPGAELRAAAGRDPERTEALGASVRHTDYAALVADEQVDVVYIALHNSAHAFWATEALRAGKHVLCEKPLGLSAAEVRSMADAAAASNRLLVEASWNRWHPRTRELARLLESRVIGDVRHVEAVFDGADPAPHDYRRDATLGGGALLDVGCYAIAASLAAHEWAKATVTAVRRETWPGGTADRVTEAFLEIGNGTAAISSSLTGEGNETLEIAGSDGTIRLDSPFTAGRESCALVIRTAGGTESVRFPPVDPYGIMAAEMTRAVARGASSAFLVPLEQSLAVAETMDSVASRAGHRPA